MIKIIRGLKHFYILLVPLGLMLILLSLWFRYYPVVQLELIILGSSCYIGSALLHHYFDKSLTLGIILEYILLASLVIIVVTGAIYR